MILKKKKDDRELNTLKESKTRTNMDITKLKEDLKTLYRSKIQVNANITNLKKELNT